MNTLKHKNMMRAYSGFTGTQTLHAITQQIPADLIDALTGWQLGRLMDAITKAYLSGRASTGADVYDDNPLDGAVWINCLSRSIEWRDTNGSLTLTAREKHCNDKK